LYDRKKLVKVLEKNGYVKGDIQKQNIAGDMLQFALLILLNEKLDKLVKKN
jgi:hypothetical protein